MCSHSDLYLEAHTFSQYKLIQQITDCGIKMDFLGKFENLPEDFEKLRTRFGLLPLKSYNISTKQKNDWRDFYTLKTAGIVYQGYRDDFEQLGYEDEYPELQDYLATKRSKKWYNFRQRFVFVRF